MHHRRLLDYVAKKRSEEDRDDSKSKSSSDEFGFGEYAETVGPQGLLFVLKGPDIPYHMISHEIYGTNH